VKGYLTPESGKYALAFPSSQPILRLSFEVFLIRACVLGCAVSTGDNMFDERRAAATMIRCIGQTDSFT
jgi:hypothetical protein